MLFLAFPVFLSCTMSERSGSTIGMTAPSAGLPGCLHSLPCAITETAAEVVDALRDRWPPEHADACTNTPGIGWFRDAKPAAL